MTNNIYNQIKEYTALTVYEINHLINTVAFAPQGNVVIAGTYLGGDVMSMTLTSPEREYHVIDSFQGLAAPAEEDMCDAPCLEGEFNAGGLEKWIDNFKIKQIRAPRTYPMFIDENTIQSVDVNNIAVLWLDLDHYIPTKACLNHFYDKVVPGGKILTHDYDFHKCPGVRKACDPYGETWEIPRNTGIGQIYKK